MHNEHLMRLGNTYGTPLYVFDEREMQRRIKFVRQNLPPKTGICYAMKANPFVLPRLAHAIDRIEVCSAGEHNICQSLSVDPKKLVISGVSKDEDMIRRAIETQGTAKRYTVESIEQFNMLLGIARDYSTRLQLLLRISSGNQFGMDLSTVKNLASLYGLSPYLDIYGIQYYSGTQKKSLERIERELNFLDNVAKRLQAECGLYVREIEYGPGFPVDYFSGDSQQDAEAREWEFLRGFSNLLATMKPRRTIVLELGRSLVASCGTYLTRVIDAKQVEKEAYAIVDGGMHHLAYYGNSLALKQPPCRLLARSDESDVDESPSLWNICGSLCTSNDMLAKRMPLKGLNTGSILAFDQAGAYCMTEGIALFLSRDLPAVVIVDRVGSCRIVRERLPTSPANTPQVSTPWID